MCKFSVFVVTAQFLEPRIYDNMMAKNSQVSFTSLRNTKLIVLNFKLIGKMKDCFLEGHFV